MVKITASSKPTDTVRTSKTRARKSSPEVGSTKMAPSKVSPTKAIPTRVSQEKVAPTRVSSAKASRAKVSSRKAAIKEPSKDVSREPAKVARKVNPKEKVNQKGNGQAAARLKAIRMKQTKAQIMQTLTEETGLPRRDVVKVMATLATLAKRHVMKRGSGEFSIPELGVKVRRVQRKARMARNPMTGEPVRVPAKTAVKATVLKALKDAVL
ncbi:MAG: HU family DNA-binding protein [Gammaproteobacteria bacterium]